MPQPGRHAPCCCLAPVGVRRLPRHSSGSFGATNTSEVCMRRALVFNLRRSGSSPWLAWTACSKRVDYTGAAVCTHLAAEPCCWEGSQVDLGRCCILLCGVGSGTFLPVGPREIVSLRLHASTHPRNSDVRPCTDGLGRVRSVPSKLYIVSTSETPADGCCCANAG